MANRMNYRILAGMLAGTALSNFGCAPYIPRYQETPMPDVPIRQCTHMTKRPEIGLELCDDLEESTKISGIFCLIMRGQIPVYTRVYNSSQSPVKILSSECFISDNQGEHWTYLPVKEMIKNGALESNRDIGDVIFEALFVPKIISAPHRIGVLCYNADREKDIKHKNLPPIVSVEPGKEAVGFIPLIREKDGFVKLAERLPGGNLHFFTEEDGERKAYRFILGKPEVVLTVPNKK